MDTVLPWKLLELHQQNNEEEASARYPESASA